MSGVTREPEFELYIGVNFSDFPIKGKEGVSEFEFTE